MARFWVQIVPVELKGRGTEGRCAGPMPDSLGYRARFTLRQGGEFSLERQPFFLGVAACAFHSVPC